MILQNCEIDSVQTLFNQQMSLKFLVFAALAKMSSQLTPVTVVGVNNSGTKLQNELCTTCGYCYTGTNSWYVSTVGYTLSKVDLWIPSSGVSFYAMQLTFQSSGGTQIVSPLMGTTLGASYSSSKSTFPILKQITEVTVYQDTTTSRSIGSVTITGINQSGFMFKFSDNTTLNVGNQVGTAFKAPVNGNLVGFDCSFHSNHGNDNRNDGCYLYVDTCIVTTITDRTIPTTTVQAGSTAIVNLSFADSSGTQYLNSSLCPKTYTVAPTLIFATLSQTSSSASLSLAPAASDEGTYNLSLEVKVTEYPDKLIPASFTVIVACTVTSISLTGPSSTTFTFGIDSQPLTVTFPYTKNKACPLQTPTLSLSPSNLSFLQSSISATDVQIVLNGASTSDNGSYSVNITITLGSLTSTKNWTLKIVDLCKSAQIVVSPTALTGMVVNAPSTSSQTQTFSFTTDVTSANPSINCALQAVLSPSAAYISLSGSMTTITIDESKVGLPNDIGNHSFQVTISSLTYPAANVTPKVLGFNVQIICPVTNISTTEKPVDATYVLNQGIFQTLALNLVQLNACNFAYTFNHSFTFQGGPISQPTWINFDTASRTYSMTITAPSDVGVYTVKSTVSIAQVDPLTGVNRIHSEQFVLTVKSDCINTALIDATLNDMTIKVNQPQITQSLDIFKDTIANFHTQPQYCGQRSFLLSPTYQFLWIAQTSLVLQSQSVVDEGIYSVQVTISLAEYPFITPITKQIQITVLCEITSMSFLTKPSATLTYKILVDPPIIQTFSYTHSLICKNLVFELTPVYSFPVVLDTLSKSVTISSSNLLERGVYDFTLTIKPAGTTIGVSTSTIFKVYLLDMCQQAVFAKQIIPNLEVVRNSPEYNSKQNSIYFREFQYFPKIPFSLDCGPVQVNLYQHNSREQPPSWITLSTNRIDADFQKQSKSQTVSLDLVVSLQDYADRFLATLVNVTLSDTAIHCLPTNDAIYRLGQSSITKGPYFRNETYVSQLALTPVIQPVIFNDQGIEIKMPRFVSFQKNTKLFEIAATDQGSLGFYQLGLRIGYSEFPDSVVTCRQQLDIIYDPVFNGPELQDQTIIVGQEWSYTLPVFYDFFKNIAKFECQLEPVKSFITQAKNLLTLKVSPTSRVLVESIGSYEISVTLTDTTGRTEIRSFNLKVIQIETMKQTFIIPPPKPFIIFHNNAGKMRVGFTRPLVLPTFERFPEFNEDLNFNRNCTNGGECSLHRQLVANPLNSEKQQAIQIVNHGLVWANNTAYPLIRLQVIPGEDSDPSNLNFTWSCVDLTESQMDFLIHYQHVEDVSMHDYKDKIEINFIGNQYLAANDGQTLSEEHLILEKQLPLQIEPKAAARIHKTSVLVSGASKAVMIGTFLQNLFLGGVLSELFASIKKLQLMVHLLLTKVRIPPNAAIYFSGLLNFVTYDLINTEPLLRKWLKLVDNQELEESFQSLGYLSKFFVINIGSLFLVAIYLLIKVFLALTTKNVKVEWVQRARVRAEKDLFWNGLLSYVEESLVIFSLCFFLQCQDLLFDSGGTRFSVLLAMVFGGVSLALPFISLGLLIKNRTKLNTEECRNSIGSVYESLKYQRGLSLATLLEPSTSQLRVILMMATMVFVRHAFMQIFINNMLILYTVIYTQVGEVYRDKTANRFAVFNESCVCLINYHMLLCANLLVDQRGLKIVGWSAIVIVTLNIFINFAQIFQDRFKDVYKQLRLKYYLRKRDRLLKDFQKRQDELLLQQESSEQLEKQIAKRDLFRIEIDSQENRQLALLGQNQISSSSYSESSGQFVSSSSLSEFDLEALEKNGIRMPHLKLSKSFEKFKNLQSSAHENTDKSQELIEAKTSVFTDVQMKKFSKDQCQEIGNGKTSLINHKQHFPLFAGLSSANVITTRRPSIALQNLEETKEQKQPQVLQPQGHTHDYVPAITRRRVFVQQIPSYNVEDPIERAIRIAKRNKQIQRDFPSLPVVKQMFDELWQDSKRD